ncbi:MAG: hypothetical protein LCH46_05305 [Proteobacteria bacterium]|nr:hypothetical protein [Pseudomonadota bacterium]
MDQEPRAEQRHHWHRKRIALIAVLCAIGWSAVIYGGYWLFKETRNTLAHIVPTRGISISRSMSPYDISLKRRSKSGSISEWKLAVPRAFVVDETGQNGSLPPLPGENTGHFSVRLAVFARSDDQLRPWESKFDLSAKERNLVVAIGNGSPAWWITKYDLCVPAHRAKEFAPSNVARRRDIPCLDQVRLCKIATQLDGWSIGIAATKDFYAEPDKTCRLVKDFLDQYTIARSPASPAF